MVTIAESALPEKDLRRLCGLQILMAGIVLAQLWTSFLLWTPQSFFPQVPVISGFVWPDPVAWSLLMVCGAALLGMVVSSVRHQIWRWPHVVFLISVLALILEDQHRAQPWIIHYLWISAFLALGPARRTLGLVLGLTASIYLYSALSKCNLMFLDQHGQIILSGLFQALHLDLDRFPEVARRVMIATFPIGELLISVGLLFRKSRQWAAILSMVMHGALILTFSSRGLNHEWSVLLWNGFFLIQAAWLWIIPASRASPEIPNTSLTSKSRDRLGIILVLVLWTYPALRFSGHLDQWAGWSLYSPRADVIRVMLLQPPEHIDEDFPDFTNAPYRLISGDDRPLEFLSDRWSLSALRVPLNPESRLELAVAHALCESYDCWEQIAIIHERRNLMSPEQREVEHHFGREKIELFASHYRLPAIANRRYRKDSPLRN